MVCCDLIKKSDKTATYSYSRGYGEKGIIEFPLKMRGMYTIKKKAEPECGELWINKLFAKYTDDFLNGEAKEKIFYQCG